MPDAAVPDPHFRDQLAEVARDFLSGLSEWPTGLELADALLPLIDAHVQAAANQRAAEAWDEGLEAGWEQARDGGGSSNPYRAALAQPAPGRADQ